MSNKKGKRKLRLFSQGRECRPWLKGNGTKRCYSEIFRLGPCLTKATQRSVNLALVLFRGKKWFF